MSAASSKKPSDQRQRFYGPITAIPITIFSYFGAYIAFFLVAGVGVAIYRLLQGNRSLESLSELIETSVAGQFVSSLLIYGFMALLVYAFMRLLKVKLSDIGLSRKPIAKDFGWALATFAAYFITLIVVTALVSQFVPSINLDQEQQLDFDKATQGPALILIFIALAIIPPLVEEFVMRGFLYTGVRRAMRFLPAAIITSFIFSIAHLQLGAGAPPLYVAAIDTFVLSMFLVAIREKTGSIWAGIFVHGLKNTLAFSALFLFTS